MHILTTLCVYVKYLAYIVHFYALIAHVSLRQ